MKPIRTTEEVRAELAAVKAEFEALSAEDKLLRNRIAAIDRRQDELRGVWSGGGIISRLSEELKIAATEEADADKPRIHNWVIISVTPKLVRARHYGSLSVSRYGEKHATIFPFEQAREMWAQYLAAKENK